MRKSKILIHQSFADAVAIIIRSVFPFIKRRRFNVDVNAVEAFIVIRALYARIIPAISAASVWWAVRAYAGC